MKLLTKEVINRLPPLYSQDGKAPETVKVAVKFFTPDAQCTWYITEGEQQENDWRFFGLCDLGLGFPELGYVHLSELQQVRGQFGLPIERDLHYRGTLADAMRTCHYQQAAAATVEPPCCKADAEAGTEVVTLDAPESPQSVEVIPATQSIAVPLKFIAAALLTASKDDIRYYLNGVFLHAVDGEIRICGTDGHRMIVSRFVPPKEERIPSWAEAGIILPRDALAQALPILTKNSAFNGYDASEPSAIIEHAPGMPTVTLGSVNGFASFKVTPIDGKFPQYAPVLAQSGAVLACGEGEAMETAAIDTRFIKGAADVAAKLGAKAIHSFVGKTDQVSVFTFDGAPDTVLIIMPMRTGPALSDGVVKLLGNGSINASVAALRAHVTRTTKLLESSKDQQEIEQAERKRDALNERINRLLAVASDAPKQLTQQPA